MRSVGTNQNNPVKREKKARQWCSSTRPPTNIDKLLDPIHFVKNYKSELYTLVALAKKNSETCKGDAVRLSRNLSYTMAQYAPTQGTDPHYTFDNFVNAGKASFEHHWNNHQYCGDWCKPKKWTEESTSTGTRLRTKENMTNNSK
jgi:hypothetical protein